jgi:hypothetical protein
VTAHLVRPRPGAYARRVRYCPNLSCSHRLRVASPAEFFDHIARCSDCGSRLVSSQDDAIAGRQPVTNDPYRMPAAVPPEADAAPRAAMRRVNVDAVLSAALIAVGLFITVLTFASSSRSGGVHVVAFGPVLYGFFRLFRAPAPRG